MMEKIAIGANRVVQFKPGVGQNQQVRASEFNDLVEYVSTADILIANGSTLSLTKQDTGKTIILDRAAGCTVTLPIDAIGLTYKFLVTTTVTSNSYIVTSADAADLMMGGISIIDDVTPEVATMFKPDLSNDIIMTMNGTTTGGKIGTEFTVTCVKENRWYVAGRLAGSGTLATPFS